MRTLNDAQGKNDITQTERLSIFWTVLILRHHLDVTRFIIRDDHDFVKWILNLAHIAGKLARWRLCLSEYELDVVHRTGTKH